MKKHKWLKALAVLACGVVCSGALASCDVINEYFPQLQQFFPLNSSSSSNTGENPDKKPEPHVHSFGKWTWNGEADVPCEERTLVRVCSGCDIAEEKQGAYADHTWSVKTVLHTCTTQGYDEKTCTSCGKIEKDNIVAAAHAWETMYSFNANYHWQVCVACEQTQNRALHSLNEDGVCKDCENPLQDTAGVVYEVSSDGTYAQVISYTGTAKSVKIADSYNGKAVTMIGENAFANTDIKRVVLPESIVAVHYSAFSGCEQLQYNIYGNCLYLRTVNNPCFAAVGVVDKTLFQYALHEDTKIIGDQTFADCSNMTAITIPQNVTIIGYNAFLRCTALTSITLENAIGWSYKELAPKEGDWSSWIPVFDLAVPKDAARYFKSKHESYGYWKRG